MGLEESAVRYLRVLHLVRVEVVELTCQGTLKLYQIESVLLNAHGSPLRRKHASVTVSLLTH